MKTLALTMVLSLRDAHDPRRPTERQGLCVDVVPTTRSAARPSPTLRCCGDQQVVAGARAALYTGAGTGNLVNCSSLADRVGLRVVTVVDEDDVGLSEGAAFGGPRLAALVDRLCRGEFEVIVADAGTGRAVTITAISTGDYVPPLAQAEDMLATQAPVGTIPTQAKIRCVIYGRCASFAFAAPHALATQISDCEAYAAERDWKTVATYTDTGVGGRAVSRPGIDEMMVAAKDGAFDVLLIEELSQLSPNASHIYSLLREMKVLGVAVHTVGGGVISSLEMAIGEAFTARSMREEATRKRLRLRRKLRQKPAVTGHDGGNS